MKKFFPSNSNTLRGFRPGSPAALVARSNVEKGLRALSPEVPWTHLIDLHGCPTIKGAGSEKWLKKAEGLERFGEIALQLVRSIGSGQTVEGKTVLDLGCGEAGHAIMFGQAGATRVVGVEGRSLSVERARFATAVLGLHQIEIIERDVRALDAVELGAFDVVLCSGMLHHIEQEQWWPFVRLVGQLTKDLAIFYTHVGNQALQAEHKLRPASVRTTTPEPSGKKPLSRTVRDWLHKRQVAEEEFEGFLFREHRAGATAQEKMGKVRASLDNEESFWATEEALLTGLRKAGFQMVLKVQAPHMFKSRALRDTRQIIVAKKMA